VLCDALVVCDKLLKADGRGDVNVVALGNGAVCGFCGAPVKVVR
jgi:hypothetical protein